MKRDGEGWEAKHATMEEAFRIRALAMGLERLLVEQGKSEEGALKWIDTCAHGIKRGSVEFDSSTSILTFQTKDGDVRARLTDEGTFVWLDPGTMYYPKDL